MREELWQARRAAIDECAQRGLCPEETASFLNMCTPTVKRYATKYGIAFGSESTIAEAGLAEMREIAANGGTRREAAEALGRSYQWLARVAKANDIEFRHGREGEGVDYDRADAMASMYRSGKTLEQIGSVYGVSRERVRQVIKQRHGMTAEDGGMRQKAARRKERIAARKERDSLEKHGCTYAEYRGLVELGRELRASGETYYRTPTGAFTNQKNNATARGIPFELKLWEWWQIWQESGKWEQRGRFGDGYVMCRLRDEGPYSRENVYIATLRHNSRVQLNNPYRKSHPDFEKTMARKSVRVGTRVSCSVAGCDKPHYAHGWCNNHYYHFVTKPRQAERVAAA